MSKRGNYSGNKTPSAMNKYNEKLQARRLTELIKANFSSNDYFITLHYKRDNKQTFNTAKKKFNKFIKRIKYLYELNNKSFKYIKATRAGKRGGISHYMIFNSGIPSRIIKRLWEYSDTPPTIKRLSELKERHYKRPFLPMDNKNYEIFERKYIGSRNLLREKENPEGVANNGTMGN